MITPVDEIRLAGGTLRRIARRANGFDWLPLVEKTPEDSLVQGVIDVDGEQLIVGGCSHDNEIADEDAMYISLLSPAMAIPIADWLEDAASCIARGGFVDRDAARLLGRALQVARQINQRYRKIRATGIYEMGEM